MQQDGIVADKRALRRQAKALRAGLCVDVRDAASLRIAEFAGRLAAPVDAGAVAAGCIRPIRPGSRSLSA